MMAVRWRQSGKNKGKIECAAVSKALKSDCYISDNLHYELAVIQEVLIPIGDGKFWRWKTNKRIRERRK